MLSFFRWYHVSLLYPIFVFFLYIFCLFFILFLCIFSTFFVGFLFFFVQSFLSFFVPTIFVPTIFVLQKKCKKNMGAEAPMRPKTTLALILIRGFQLLTILLLWSFVQYAYSLRVFMSSEVRVLISSPHHTLRATMLRATGF
jgi:Mn2+/Fe2+ NRAMP family transporter